MILLWRGWGILVPIIFVVVMFGTLFGLEVAISTPGYIESHPWTWVLTGLLCALPIWFLGKRLNGKKDRVLVDKETGEELTLRVRHDFFFIPMQYWGAIILVFYVGAAIKKLVE